MPEKFQPETFTLFAHEANRADEQYRLDQFIRTLPIDSVFTAKITKGEPTRSDVANKLYQVCISQIVEQLGKDESATAGWSKYQILLPMKLPYAAQHENDELQDQAEFERELCDHILLKYNGQDLYKAFDRAIRSKNSPVGLFAKYIERLIMRWSSEGVVFRLKPSERDRVMGNVQ